MAYDVCSTVVRVVTFAVLWICFHVAAVFVNFFFIHAAGVVHLVVISLFFQFPIAVTLYCLFDWSFRSSALFRTRPRTLLAVGFAGVLVLYYPSLLLVLAIIR